MSANNKKLWLVLTKEVLNKELFDNNLRQTEIARKYNCSTDIVNVYIDKYGIIPKYSNSHFRQMRLQEFTQEQLDLIYGTLLGDGHLAHQHGTGYHSLMIEHELKQESYCLYKKNILNNFVLSHRYNKKNMCDSISFQTIKHPKLTEIRHFLYKNNKKVITEEYLKHINPRALAFWFMDDGTSCEQPLNLGSYNTYLCTHDYSLNEQYLVVDFLKNKYNIDSTVGKDKRKNKLYHRISFCKTEALKLLSLIQPYVPKCMNYKLELVKSNVY